MKKLARAKKEVPAKAQRPRGSPRQIPKNGKAEVKTSKNGQIVPVPKLTAEQVKDVHQLTHDAGPYVRLLSFLPEWQDPSGMVLGSGSAYLEQYLKEMAPRNPAERMLAVQMLLQHARIARLLGLAPNNDLKAFNSVNAAIEAAMNTYRRQAATWESLRSPRPVQFFRGEQVNVARQQVIAHGSLPDPEKKILSNEQGIGHAQEAPLLPEQLGADIRPCLSPQEPAVEPVDRATHARGKVEVGKERVQARRAIRRDHGAP